jgi:hypothetical protein
MQARKQIPALRRTLTENIFRRILSFDDNNDGYFSANEFRRYVKAVGEWGTDELYTDEHWEESWPTVCSIFGVADPSRGFSIEQVNS